jgi:hypothetical protein
MFPALTRIAIIDTAGFYILIMATAYSTLWAENVVLFYTWAMFVFSITMMCTADSVGLDGYQSKPGWKLRKKPWFMVYHHLTDIAWILILASAGWFVLAGVATIYKALVETAMGIVEDRIKKEEEEANDS